MTDVVGTGGGGGAPANNNGAPPAGPGITPVHGIKPQPHTRQVMPTQEGFAARMRQKDAEYASKLQRDSAQPSTQPSRPQQAPQRRAEPPPATTARERMEQTADAYEARQEERPGQPASGAAPARDARQEQQAALDSQGHPNPDALGESAAEPETQATGEPATGPLDDAAALAKYREWEQSDLIPEEFLQRTRPVKINGVEHQVSVAEAYQGYMRGGDYRQYYNKVKAHLDESTALRGRYDEHFKTIEDPDTFLDTYERGGYGPTLMQVAKRLAERVDNDRMLANGAAIAYAQRHGITDYNDYRIKEQYDSTLKRIEEDRAVRLENKKLKIGYEQLQKQHQQTAHNTEVEAAKTQYAAQLAQLRPNAFRAYGIKDSERNRAALFRHIDSYVSAHGFPGHFTREIVMAAASDLRDEQAAERAREAALDNPPANGNGNRPLAPGRLGAGGGAIGRGGPQNAGRPKGGPVGSYEQFQKRMNGGG